VEPNKKQGSDWNGFARRRDGLMVMVTVGCMDLRIMNNGCDDFDFDFDFNFNIPAFAYICSTEQ
jgi:hypothetical protein